MIYNDELDMRRRLLAVVSRQLIEDSRELAEHSREAIERAKQIRDSMQWQLNVIRDLQDTTKSNEQYTGSPHS